MARSHRHMAPRLPLGVTRIGVIAAVLIVSVGGSSVADSVAPERLAAGPGTEQTQQRPSKEEYLRRIPPPDEQRAHSVRRDRRDQPEAVIELIGVKPAMRIGEAGSGGGYFTFVLSRAVGRDGTVYANDNDEYMLFALEHYARAFFGDLGNIVPVLGTDTDPRFRSRDLDLIVIYGSFHDFTRREEWLRNARAYLKPVGRLAIVDGYWPTHGALTKDVIVETASRAGLRLVYYKDCSRQHTDDDGTKGQLSQHVHVFALDGAPLRMPAAPRSQRDSIGERAGAGSACSVPGRLE